MIEAKGVTGTVRFDGAIVVIAREGGMARMALGKGEKRIPVRALSAIELKPPSLGVRGFIQFTVPGGIERRSKKGSRTIDAAEDENSVLFTKSQMPAFLALRDAIEAAISSPPSAPAVPTATPPPPPSAPAGWHADPFGRFELRYFDGATWTEHVALQGTQSTDPPTR